MPELPEVEVARRALEEHCVGKRITKCVAADDPKVIDGVAPKRLEEALAGKTIAAARRKGKNLWLQLDSPPFPSFQFGMAGAIYIKGVELTKYKRSTVSSTEEWPSKYSKIFVELDDGLEFSFTDKRRFARVRLLEDPESVPPISELGPDALFEPMQLNDFAESLSRKNIPIKTLLLDQGFISGIGNWIADEVLYQARIHPMQIAAKISKEGCESLHRCIKEVIEKALEVGADSSQFPKGWIFHSREKKPGKAFVDGKKIEFITIGGRTTAYVPELQKLGGSETAPSRSKRSKGGKNGGKKESAEDEEVNEGSKLKKSTDASRGRKKKPNKAIDDDDDDDDDDREEEKPAKRGRKKPAKATKSSSKEAIDSDGDEDDEDEEEGKKPVKRGRKKPVKAAKSSSKKAIATDDEDEEEEVEEEEDDYEEEEQKKPAKSARKKQAKATTSSAKKEANSAKASTKQRKRS